MVLLQILGNSFEKKLAILKGESKILEVSDYLGSIEVILKWPIHGLSCFWVDFGLIIRIYTIIVSESFQFCSFVFHHILIFLFRDIVESHWKQTPGTQLLMVPEAFLLCSMAVEEVVHLYLVVPAQILGNQVIGFYRALLQLSRSSLMDLLPIAVLVIRFLFINLWFEIYLVGQLTIDLLMSSSFELSTIELG